MAVSPVMAVPVPAIVTVPVTCSAVLKHHINTINTFVRLWNGTGTKTKREEILR